jgi:hypothetical protein
MWPRFAVYRVYPFPEIGEGQPGALHWRVIMDHWKLSLDFLNVQYTQVSLLHWFTSHTYLNCVVIASSFRSPSCCN